MKGTPQGRYCGSMPFTYAFCSIGRRLLRCYRGEPDSTRERLPRGSVPVLFDEASAMSEESEPSQNGGREKQLSSGLSTFFGHSVPLVCYVGHIHAQGDSNDGEQPQAHWYQVNTAKEEAGPY